VLGGGNSLSDSIGRQILQRSTSLHVLFLLNSIFLKSNPFSLNHSSIHHFLPPPNSSPPTKRFIRTTLFIEIEILLISLNFLLPLSSTVIKLYTLMPVVCERYAKCGTFGLLNVILNSFLHSHSLTSFQAIFHHGTSMIKAKTYEVT
jgi:hypothetical protein